MVFPLVPVRLNFLQAMPLRLWHQRVHEGPGADANSSVLPDCPRLPDGVYHGEKSDCYHEVSVPVGHRGDLADAAPHIRSLIPFRINQSFTGHAVPKPMTMPTCIIHQCPAVGTSSGGSHNKK